ncbi:unnamed protein product [Linum trigynum]|uniref:Uncharacterized protein n=1 Tax=Linum trigynum TaxID=586398 RepID=A0AAV2DE93_9ROSI
MVSTLDEDFRPFTRNLEAKLKPILFEDLNSLLISEELQLLRFRSLSSAGGAAPRWPSSLATLVVAAVDIQEAEVVAIQLAVHPQLVFLNWRPNLTWQPTHRPLHILPQLINLCLREFLVLG